MAEEISIDELIRETENLTRCILSESRRIETLAVNNARGVLLPRVFNDFKASNGSIIGRYKNTYNAPSRTKKKGQPVTLQWTDRLRASITVAKFGKGIGLGFKPGTRSGENITNAQLAGYLEDRYDKDIFALNDEEINRAFKPVDKEIDKLLIKCLS